MCLGMFVFFFMFVAELCLLEPLSLPPSSMEYKLIVEETRDEKEVRGKRDYKGELQLGRKGHW